ncbi:hypothetical protein FB107DRAFT_294438 [Schizophyllum commune]
MTNSNWPPAPGTSSFHLGSESTSSAAPQLTPWTPTDAPVPNALPPPTVDTEPNSKKRNWQYMNMATPDAPQALPAARSAQSERNHAKYEKRKAKQKEMQLAYSRADEKIAFVEGQRDLVFQELERARATILHLSRERDAAFAELGTLKQGATVQHDAAPAGELPRVGMDIDSPPPQATLQVPPQEQAAAPDVECYAESPDSSSGNSSMRRPHEIGTHIGRELPPPLMDLTSYDGHPSAVPDIEFPNGLRVCAPYLPDARNWQDNTLAFEETMMRKAAGMYKMSTDRPDMVWHRQFCSYEDTAKVVAQGMSQGVVVVIHNYPDSVDAACRVNSWKDDPALQLPYLGQEPGRGVLGANLVAQRQFHGVDQSHIDASKRRGNDLDPYVAGSLVDFRSWLGDSGKVRCLLDLTVPMAQRDYISDVLSDGALECNARSHSFTYTTPHTLVVDFLRIQNWFLLHTGRFVTMGHHDADGLATSIQIRGGGRKVWIITRGYQPVLLQKEWSQSEAQCEHEKMVDQFKQQVKDAATDTWGETDDPTVPVDERRPPIDACVLDVSAGMMVFQPPGVVHTVMTPVHTASAGAHILGFGHLHLTEFVRYCQVRNSDLESTNHDHACSVQSMVIAMAAALPARLKEGYVVYRKPMIALTLMLLEPQWYIRLDKNILAQCSDEEIDYRKRLARPNWEEGGSDADKLAKAVVNQIAPLLRRRQIGSSFYTVGREYLLEGVEKGLSWQHPGDVVDLRGCIEHFNTGHIRDYGGPDSPPPPAPARAKKGGGKRANKRR